MSPLGPLPASRFPGPFDLLVIGGGITGAGIARDAAMRGLRVALVERDDFASGTSSRSSRLIHGGLRYLEHGQLHLVFEASRERRTLMRIAPHLARPLRFTWPMFDDARIPRWKVRAGLTLYDALALFRNVAPHRDIGADAVLALEPALRRRGLTAGATYFDAATDDSRLTLANLRAARLAGATIASRAEVTALIRDHGAVRGARVCHTPTGASFDVAARVVVNATGPWSDAIRRLADPAAPPSVRGTKGVHVALPRARVGNHGALTLLSPVDGRVFFMLPASATTIVGTTDTDYDGPPDSVRATAADVDYLLRSANAYFPDAHLAPNDVVAAWAGIRPLIGGDARHPDALSREHAVTSTAPGLITISGGKLTTYRVMARDAVDAVQRALGQPVRHAATGDTPLPGGAFTSLDGEVAAAAERTGAQALAAHLVSRYGSEWRDVWSLAERDRALARPIAPPLDDIAAEVSWAIEQEMALTLGDILIRRTHVAFETVDHGLRAAREIAPRFGWDDAAVDAYAAEVDRMFGVAPRAP